MKRTIKQQVMKTKTQIPALFLILSIMFATNTFSIKRDIKLEEETYIDDIPFNTEWIVYELTDPTYELEDEAYIDDIPFNTACVTVNCNYMKAISVNYEMEDEANIDDIPFDTFSIAAKSNKDNAINLIASQK